MPQPGSVAHAACPLRSPHGGARGGAAGGGGRMAVRSAWADGSVTRVLPDRLRASLGIAAEDALRVERKAAASTGGVA